MKTESEIEVHIAGENDEKYAGIITSEMEESARQRGTGISKRSVQSIIEKMKAGKAIIALTKTGNWVGFSYFEVWENGRFLSHSGLIVSPQFRLKGIAQTIKKKLFEICRKQYPQARIFSITTGAAVMKMNTRLHFEPVSFNEITHETGFWENCRSCVNYCILKEKRFTHCLCTAMLYTPKEASKAPGLQ